MKSPLHAQCPPSVTFLGSLCSVVMIWYTCIVGFDAFPDGFIVGKSKVVEKSKVQFKSTKGQRQAWEETTYIGKIRLQSSFGRLQPFSHFQPCLKFIDLDCTGMLSLCCSLYCGAALLRKCETTKYTRHLSRI